MSTTPIQEVIPREVPKNLIPLLDWFADTLEEMVNFGSHILAWNMHPKANGEENVPPTMLFRHFLDLVDTISILVRKGTGDTPKIIIRAAFEVALYLEYLFEKDTYDRSMAFIVADTLNQIKIAKKLNSETETGKSLYKTFREEELLSKVDNLDTTELDDFVQGKERLLQMPQFEKAFKEFQRLRELRENKPNWYRYFDGPKNIEGLARHLKQTTMYELLYRKWSGAVHGSDIYLGRIERVSTEQVNIVQLRFIKDLQEVVNYSLTLCVKTFRLFVQSRLPEKGDDLKKWYLTIRETILRITSTVYIRSV